MSLEYDNYLEEHRFNILLAYDYAVEYFPEIFDKYLEDTQHIGAEFGNPLDILREQIKHHDASKFLTKEYEAYDQFFYGEGDYTDFEYAWLSHIHDNPHHWQHWVDILNENQCYPLEMPSNYIIEMLMDWWSFSWKSNDLREILSWYKDNKDHMILAPNTKAQVERFIKLVEERC